MLLVSCAAFVKRYPDPLDCHKYYLRIDDQIYNLTCPNNLKFDQNIEQCTVIEECNLPDITPLTDRNCNQNKPGYYCEDAESFTYCTHDGLKVINKATFPNGTFCLGPPRTTP